MASTTLRNPRFDEPRASTETARKPQYSESIAPSDTASVLTLTNDEINDEAGTRTPRAHSPSRESIHSNAPTLHRNQSIAAPEQAAQSSYRGFASEQAYLDALRSWAEDRKYEQPTRTTLVGFYGQTTMGELAARPPPPGFGNLRKKWRERKASKQLEREEKQNGRRATVA